MAIDDETSFIDEMSRSEGGAWRDIAESVSAALHPDIPGGQELGLHGPWDRGGRFVVRFGPPTFVDYALHDVEHVGGRTYLVLEAARAWDPDEGAVPPLVMVEAPSPERVRTLYPDELRQVLARPLVGLIKRQIMPAGDTLPELEAEVRALFGAPATWGSTLGFWEQAVEHPLVLDGYALEPGTSLLVHAVKRVSPPLVRLGLGVPSGRPSRSGAPDPDEEPSPESLRRGPMAWYSVEAIAVVGSTFVGVLAARASQPNRSAGRTSDDAELSMVALSSAGRWRTLTREASAYAAPTAAAAVLRGTPCSPLALHEALGLVGATEPRVAGTVAIAMRSRSAAGPRLRARVHYTGYKLALQGDYLVRACFLDPTGVHLVLSAVDAGEDEDAPARLLCRVVDPSTLALVDDAGFRAVAGTAYATLLSTHRIDERALVGALGPFRE
ncbi:MAG: hypothetical protein HY908_06225 [Myxococcales bacterium]|nr:hypothetical protein [Myxococcales bacterium]